MLFGLKRIHLKSNDTLNCKNYKWFGYNRCLQKKNVKKGFWWLGIFVKDIVIKNYTIDIIERNVNGVLGLKFCLKIW